MVIKMPTIDMEATGTNIKDIMTKCNMTVVDMQETFGFNTPQAIYKWFRGAAIPTIDNIIILAAIFKVKIDDIVIVKTI